MLLHQKTTTKILQGELQVQESHLTFNYKKRSYKIAGNRLAKRYQTKTNDFLLVIINNHICLFIYLAKHTLALELTFRSALMSG